MKPKKLLLLLLFLVSFALIGCSDLGRSSSFELTAKMVKENLKNTEPDTVKNEVKVVDLSSYTIIEGFYKMYGAVIVQNELGEKSVLSLFTGELVFPYESEITINIYYRYAGNFKNAAYVKVTDSDNKIAIYDLFGNTLLEKDEYAYADVTVNESLVYDIKGDIVERAYYEVVSYRYTNMETLQKKYKIDYYTGKRELVDNKDDEYVGKIEKYSLDAIGLKDYCGYPHNDKIYIYDKDDKFINSFEINTDANYFLTGGKLISQMQYEVEKDAKEYTFVSNGKKYKLVSKQIDLLTGKEKKLNLDYVISNYEPFKDENGNYKYVIAKINKIRGRNLLSDSVNVILDSNGKILKELEFSNINYLKVVDDHFVDMGSGLVFNSKFGPTLSLGVNIKSVHDNEKLIVVNKNGTYGAVDKTGKIIIPFEYSMIYDRFVDGKVFAKDLANNKYILNANGSKKKLDDSVQFITSGIYMQIDENGYNHAITFNSISGDELSGFSISNLHYTNDVISNIYGDFAIYNFYGLDSEYSVIINTTVRM